MSHYYTRELQPPCLKFGDAAGCSGIANVEVFNTYNASMGKFCRRCAKQAIAYWKHNDLIRERQTQELQEAEDADT
jgi:hypothetical protein